MAVWIHSNRKVRKLRAQEYHHSSWHLKRSKHQLLTSFALCHAIFFLLSVLLSCFYFFSEGSLVACVSLWRFCTLLFVFIFGEWPVGLRGKLYPLPSLWETKQLRQRNLIRAQQNLKRTPSVPLQMFCQIRGSRSKTTSCCSIGEVGDYHHWGRWGVCWKNGCKQASKRWH